MAAGSASRLAAAPMAAAALALCVVVAAAAAAAAPGVQAAHAAPSHGGAYYVEGAGYAGAAHASHPSQFGLAVSTGPAEPGGRSALSVSGGVVSFGAADYLPDRLSGSLLRNGDLIRISGTATGGSGASIEVSILGKLVQDGGAGGSIYLFTGRITDGGLDYKAVYASRVSAVGGGNGGGGAHAAPDAPDAPAAPQGAGTGRPAADATLRILPGSSDPGLGSHSDRVGSARSAASTAYFDPTRLSVATGSTVRIVNDDAVAHLIISGAASGSSRGALVLCSDSPDGLPPGFDRAQPNCTFTMDGRVNTGEIAPGSSATVAFADRGVYRLIDPHYPWMRLDVFALEEPRPS